MVVSLQPSNTQLQHPQLWAFTTFPVPLSLGSGRYLGRPRAEQTVLVRPPFLRPEVSDGQITVKIMDNGIQTELKRTKVRKGGICTPHVGVLHGAQGCKPASVSKEPSEPWSHSTSSVSSCSVSPRDRNYILPMWQ